MTTTNATHKFGQTGYWIAIFTLLVVAAPETARASTIPRIWLQLYKELNHGDSPSWRKVDDAKTWATAEKAQLEPVVASMLRGEIEDMPWAGALAVVQTVYSPQIADLLHVRLHEIADDPGRRCPLRFSEDAVILGSLIRILAEAKDERVRSTSEAIIVNEHQSYEVIEHAVKALGEVGNQDSVLLLSKVKLRNTDRHMDSLCGLTEKLIDARLKGQPINPNAQEELKSLARSLVRAIRDHDFAGYVRLYPPAYAEIFEREEVEREVFGSDEVRALINQLEASLDREFEVSADSLRATLSFGEHHRLECILEVDGWKVAVLR